MAYKRSEQFSTIFLDAEALRLSELALQESSWWRTSADKLWKWHDYNLVAENPYDG